MLASKEEGAAPDALRFSLASDIVELVVLTADESFLHILREAVGDTRRLWHVPTADKVSDLLVAGEVGILILDVQALNEAATEFVGQIKRQFPDLVVVAAGTRDAETSLAGLISSGMIYRFIHKPMSPGRARLFADAAVRRYEEQRRRAAAAPSVKRPSRPNRGLKIYAAVGVLGVIAVATWAFHRNAPAGAGLPESSGASQADGASQAAAIETARKSGVENGRIAFLTAQLAKSREQKKSAQARPEVRPEVRREAKAADSPVAAPLPSAAAANSEPSQSQADMQASAELLKNAGERLQQDRLIEPANDSAKYYLLALRGLDPGNAGLPAAMQDLGTRLTDKARRALALEQYDAARSWLEEAGAVGFSSADSDSLRRGLGEAAIPIECRRLGQPRTHQVDQARIPRQSRAESGDGLGRAEFHRGRGRCGEGHRGACVEQPRSLRRCGSRGSVAVALQTGAARCQSRGTEGPHTDSFRSGGLNSRAAGQAAELRLSAALSGSCVSAPISAPIRRSSTAPNACLRTRP